MRIPQTLTIFEWELNISLFPFRTVRKLLSIHVARRTQRDLIVLLYFRVPIRDIVCIRGQVQRVNPRCFNNKRLKRRATCDVARVARRLLRTISRHYRKFLCFWFMQQCTLSYVISALVVFAGRREAFGFVHALFNVSLDIYGI